MNLVLFILIIGIGCSIFWAVKKSNQDNAETPTITYSHEYNKEEKPEPEKKSGGTTITYGSGMKPGRPLEAEHTITEIYASEKKKTIWICPNCEVENRLEDEVCCVCRKVV